MRYEPKYLTPREILLKAGYTDEDTFRGMTRKIFHVDDNKINPAKRKRAKEEIASSVKIRALKLSMPKVKDRYHALYHEGVIDLHMDVNENGKHRAVKFNHLVTREVLWFGLHDTPKPN